jgi:uncharacterized protein (TIGR00255 family)
MPLPPKFWRLDGALDDFIVARETEGQALKALIEQRLEGVTAEVAKVRAHMPEICNGSASAWSPNWKMRKCSWKTTVSNKSWC